MRRRTLTLGVVRGLRGLGAAAAVWAAASCHEPLDTTREAPPKGTLGDDIFGVLCDRVGASSLTEDLTGASYQALCHYDGDGSYADAVDTKLLPPVSGDAAERSRQLALAKLHAMARRRGDLIRAINAAFPDVEIPDASTEAEGDTVRMHDALFRLAQTMAPLYEQNPYDPAGKPLFPASTQSLGRLFDAFADSAPARDALSRIQGRQGYRPTSTVLGAIRAALAYPRLRDLTKASVEVLGPDGVAVPQLQQMLTIAKQELITSRSNVSQLPELVLDGATGQPSRPRSNIEVMRELLLASHDTFDTGAPPGFIVQRDRRGFVSVPAAAPFADTNGDGFADVDAFGRFVDASGAPLAVDPPFSIAGVAPIGSVDEFGRPAGVPYGYLDTSKLLGGALSRTMRPLFDATSYAAPEDPDAWQSEHEALMYAMAGAYFLYGDREEATYDYANDAILPAGATCERCVPYLRFRGEDSPMAHLAHATGQLLADEDSDAILLGLADLLENHEQTVARLLGAALEVRRITAEHDDAARQGQEPLAEMPYETPIWDEVAEVLAKITERPGLTARLIAAFGDQALVTPHATSNHMGDTLAAFMRYRDELTYDPDDVNGEAINVTVGGGSLANPMTPVDPAQPKTGDNRSCMQRSFLTIHDANRATACNKQGAELYTNLPFPQTIGNYAECDFFEFGNVATFYLDSMLPDTHPKKAELGIKDAFLDGITDLAGLLGISTDFVFEFVSGIDGLRLKPTTRAMNRLVFFGADSGKYPNMPDLDPFRTSLNETTNLFVSNMIEPVSAAVCPKNASGANDCASQTDVLRVRDAGTIFLWERLGFYDYLRPTVVAFADEPCAANEPADCGEQHFVDLIDILNRHWPGPEHGSECNNTGSAETNSYYCSEAGVNTYEALSADAFETDLIPAIVEFSNMVSQLSTVTVRRGPKSGQVWTGAEVLEKVTRILFSTEYAASVNMVDRSGNKSTTWVNGKTQPQLTGFTLFADALHQIDARFDQSGETDALARKGQWKRARSEMVDAFFAIEGTGPAAQFKNPATPQMLLRTIRLLQEQLNANCPDRETTGACPWAKETLGDKVAETLSGPMFASMMDVQEALRAHEPARRELEKLMLYLLDAAALDPSFQATLASLTDIVQIVANDDVFAPIFQAAASAASPEGDTDGPGCADTTIKVLKALTSDEYDPYHALDHVLPALVTPMDGGAGPSPIEVFLDVIADVNRIDAGSAEPLTEADYALVFGTVRDFLTDDTRGLEQFYTIVQNRPRE